MQHNITNPSTEDARFRALRFSRVCASVKNGIVTCSETSLQWFSRRNHGHMAAKSSGTDAPNSETSRRQLPEGDVARLRDAR